ncbi:MAG: T9SS type A sorting domain-containing protein, partial [Bacteroidales bacterium]
KNIYSYISCVVMCIFFNTSLYSQTDVTPSKFKFSAMQAGTTSFFDEVVSGANPPANYAPAKNNTEGYAIIGGAPAFFPTAGNAINSNTAIVLHPEMGQNVLMFKGKNSGESLGVVEPATIGGFWSMNFYADKSFPAKTNVRVSVVMKCVAESSFGANDAIKLSVTSVANSTLVPDQEAIFLMDEGWWIFETDFMVPELTGCPPRFKFSIDGGKADNISFYMTDIKLTANPVGLPVIDEYKPLSDNLTDIDNIKVFAHGDKLHITGHENAKVKIHDTSGALIFMSETTADHFVKSLSKGIYLVQVGGKVFKVIV